MCTLTFIPRAKGYYLVMNRDEQLTRVAGLPPSRRIINGHSVLSPSEPGGGTWIVLGENLTSFALINWYSVRARVKDKPVSRGEVVNSVSASDSIERVDAALVGLPLQRINPFRLVGIFPATCEVVEWQWDLKKIVRKHHRWKPRQWISSGLDEAIAQRIRSETFRKMQLQHSAGTLAWLRRLHRSHSPGRGPFSTCMHRPDAATVSYTEIKVVNQKGTMSYKGMAPCCD